MTVKQITWEEELALIIESSEDAIIGKTLDSKIVSWNPGAENIYGYSASEAIGKPISILLHPDEPDEMSQILKKVKQGERIAHYEATRIRKDGTKIYVSLAISPIKDSEGSIIGASTIARDITERKRAEEHARDASLYTRSLIEASLDPLVTISPEGKITDVNEATELVTGVARDQLIGSDFSEYFTEPDKARAGYQQVLKEGLVKDYPLAIRHPSGRTTDVLYNASVYEDEDGKVVGVFAAARDVTERKKAEEQLSRLAAIVESSEDAIIGKTLDGKIVSWNPGAENIYGYTADEVIGKPVSVLTPPDQPDEVPQILERIKLGERIDHYETVRVRKDKTKINISTTISPIKNADGEIIGASTIARDVTERKRAEEALREASLYARSLIEASLDPLVTISPDGRITDVNEATELVTGVARDQLIGSDFSEYFTEPDKARAGYKQVLTEGLVRDYPLAIHHTSGKITDVLYNASVYEDEDGKVVGVFAAARDVTERKQAEEQARTASLYARSLIEASLDPLVTISPEGKITDVNDATELVTGHSREHLIGSDFSEYFTEPPKARAGYKQVLKEGLVRDYPLAIRHTSGKITDVLYNATVYKNEDGEVVGVFAAARDVTERKQAEEQARTASLYARSLIEASLDPLVTISPEGKITDVNEATELVTGYPRKHLIGSDFSEYFTAPKKAREGYKQVLAEGLVRDYPLAIRHTTDKITDVLYNATVYKNEDGQVVGVFAAARDVTERKKDEERIINLNKSLEHTANELSAINKELEAFSYSVSHDLSAPLRSIDGFSQAILDDYEKKLDDEGKDYLQRIRKGSQRMAQLIDDMLKLSRITRGDMQRQRVNLSSLIETMAADLQQNHPEREVDFVIAKDISATGDPRLLRMALDNLLGNAWKFTSKRKNAKIVFGVREHEGNLAYFVQDNGAGFDMNYADKLFGAFQRLHSATEFPGTGIGLAIVQRTIHRHGGRVWAESKVDKGATFYFTI